MRKLIPILLVIFIIQLFGQVPCTRPFTMNDNQTGLSPCSLYVKKGAQIDSSLYVNGYITADSLVGDITGDITGNVTGSITGNLGVFDTIIVLDSTTADTTIINDDGDTLNFISDNTIKLSEVIRYFESCDAYIIDSVTCSVDTNYTSTDTATADTISDTVCVSCSLYVWTNDTIINRTNAGYTLDTILSESNFETFGFSEIPWQSDTLSAPGSDRIAFCTGESTLGSPPPSDTFFFYLRTGGDCAGGINDSAVAYWDSTTLKFTVVPSISTGSWGTITSYCIDMIYSIKKLLHTDYGNIEIDNVADTLDGCSP